MVKYVHSGYSVEASEEKNQTAGKDSAEMMEEGPEAPTGVGDDGPPGPGTGTGTGTAGEDTGRSETETQDMEAAAELDTTNVEKQETEPGGGEAGSAAGDTASSAESQASEADEEKASGTEPPKKGAKGFLASLFSDDEAEPDGDGEESGTGGTGRGAGNTVGSGEDSGEDSGATGYGDESSSGTAAPENRSAAADSGQGGLSWDRGMDPDAQDAEASDELGVQDAEASEEPGAQNAEASDELGAQNAEASDELGAQDAEASDELGAQEPESGKKGFFARLFGDDEETEDDADQAEDAEAPAAQPKAKAAGKTLKQPEENGKSAGENAAGGAEAKKDEDPLQKKRDAERSDSLEQSIIYWQGNDNIPAKLEDTKNTLVEVMGLNSSFDVVFREMTFGGQKAALLCISGFAKDIIIDEILKRLTYLTPENISADVLASFMGEYIPHIQVEKGDVLSESITKVLSGMSVFFLEGETEVIIMDTRSYPSRNPDEPSIERVVRGARDGFTETLLSNIALVRRRVRDPGLKNELHQVGRRTRTDVCVAYIDDIVDKTQVKAVTDKIKNVNIDGIPLADKQLEEAIVGGGWNPYPMVRYSERPDAVASHLLEGRVVVFVDTSPSVMILPTTFFDLCQHAEENRQTPFMGTYLRWVRFIGIFASMFLLPLWMLLVIHPELKPPMLDFIGPQKMAKIPLLAQFLIVELGVDLLRMAAVHTPSPLGSAMGLIAAILVGDIAVKSGFFVNEVVLYMAVASIGMFATPSYELGLANRTVRLALLLAVAAFQVQGFMIGTTLLIILLTINRSYNSSYMWPFIPFNAKAMGEIIIRQPVLSSKTRPSFNKTRDNTRMPPVQEKKNKS
ncbi:stage V sporulation protein AF [Paenibacillus riograndensis SBR5]|uniref:Stage V sporulation protein AF n=2 Tax=Paenibacillus riograndensis TaxID=483937 RepID=A0A0E4HBR0_9BACL|nr:stage V sporulation protein AF [Paenibacillus riograndensis SBR5]